MSYRVEYMPLQRYDSSQNKGSAMGILMTLTVFSLYLFVLHNYFPEYKTSIQALIWPGDPAVTQNAIETMIAGLKDGIPFSQAAATFCTEIFQNAGIR